MNMHEETPSAEDVFGEQASHLFLEQTDTVDTHGDHLPHWQQGNVVYFVTWHTADALPRVKLAEFRDEKAVWLTKHPKPWDTETEQEYHHLFMQGIDKWLDAGNGACILRNPEFARIVADSLLFYNGLRYQVAAFVVMPNHVHILFRLHADSRLEDVLRSWKGYTAKEINKRLSRRGVFWQADYWDRIVRNDVHFARCWEYIRENPVLACLSPGEYAYYEAHPPDGSTTAHGSVNGS